MGSLDVYPNNSAVQSYWYGSMENLYFISKDHCSFLQAWVKIHSNIWPPASTTHTTLTIHKPLAEFKHNSGVFAIRSG